MEDKVNGYTGNSSAAGEKQHVSAGAARQEHDERGPRRAEPAADAQSLDQEDPLEEEMATYSSILSWEMPWTEESGRLRSMCS